MAKRENCEHRHTNGNCLFNGGFCLANDEEHCVRINEIKSYNQALEDFSTKMKEVNLTNSFVLYYGDEIDLEEFMNLASEEIKEQLKK